MKANICWLILVGSLAVETISSVFATSRSFITDDLYLCSPAPALQQGLLPRAVISLISNELQVPIVQIGKDLNNKVSKIGSSPPSCDGKCYGCIPCEPIKVPTITSRIGLQYTNYEPEGWKCKCGPMFYSP